MCNIDRLKLASRTLTDAGIEVFVPQPACCPGCAEGTPPAGPYVWAFERDDDADPTFWNDVEDAPDYGHLYFDLRGADFTKFVEVVVAALVSAGFAVVAPADERFGFELTLA